ncbi:MAG TPA: hypothetical protein VI603_14045 [Saprospiraceae bacterium]|nr:hypothetical protein [Saprospiraceae bacterium]
MNKLKWSQTTSRTDLYKVERASGRKWSKATSRTDLYKVERASGHKWSEATSRTDLYKVERVSGLKKAKRKVLMPAKATWVRRTHNNPI